MSRTPPVANHLRGRTRRTHGSEREGPSELAHDAAPATVEKLKRVTPSSRLRMGYANKPIG